MSKHTQGLFETVRFDDPDRILILGPLKESNGGQTVLATIYPKNTPAGEAEANAALFAASPELLSACRLALGAIPVECAVTRIIIEQAIANAERKFQS